jgi:TonB family protein
MTMLAYLLNVTICWALFALLYALLLRGETFFRANRLYLLLAVALGLALPQAGQWLGSFAVLPGTLSIELPALTLGTPQTEAAAGLLSALWWAYGVGAAFAAARMLCGVALLFRMAATGRRERLPDGACLVRTARADMPFSFFRWIFVPEHFAGNGADFEKMLAHERAHVHGGHSADVLLLELLCVLFWFHPLAHWYRRSLRTVHEYLADAEASRRTDRREYGLLLLRQAHPAQSLVFANHFFQAPLKQRLLMLTRSASPAMRGWKYSMALPVLMLLVVYFQENTAPATANAPVESPVYSPEQLTKQPEFPGGIPALVAYLSANIRYPETARRQKIEGTVLVQFVLDETGAVAEAEAVPSPKPEFGEMAAEAVRVVAQMPGWLPAQAQGQAARCRMSLPIRFKLE